VAAAGGNGGWLHVALRWLRRHGVSRQPVSAHQGGKQLVKCHLAWALNRHQPEARAHRKLPVGGITVMIVQQRLR